MIEVIATVSDRKQSSISRKAKTTTKAKTGTTEPTIWSLKSFEPATCPVIGASTPGTLPNVAGRTVSRSRSRLFSAFSWSEPPTSGTSMTATFSASCVTMSTGPFEAPEATARRRNSSSALRTGAAPMSSAFTTTCAGSAPPGKASFSRS